MLVQALPAVDGQPLARALACALALAPALVFAFAISCFLLLPLWGQAELNVPHNALNRHQLLKDMRLHYEFSLLGFGDGPWASAGIIS